MIQIILTVVAFIIIFSLLVLIHEWGHFFAARKAKVKVEEFGIGLPPRAKTLKKDKQGTIYSLNWIPIGGFVRMYGEDDPKVSKHPEAFSSKSIWRRMSIVLAGVFMNFFLAFILLTIGFSVGMSAIILPHEEQAALEDGRLSIENYIITEVKEGSFASEAGLQLGDIILSINNQEIEQPQDVSEIQNEFQGGEVTYKILRNGEEIKYQVNLNEEGKSGIGIYPNYITRTEQYPIHIAPIMAIKETGRLSVETVKFAVDFFGKIITRGQLEEGVGGPVKIADITYDLVAIGDFIIILQFTALLSISLAVINLMPIPALDGGRFLFLLVELIIRKPINRKLEILIHHIGFVALLALILAITYRDIISLF